MSGYIVGYEAALAAADQGFRAVFMEALLKAKEELTGPIGLLSSQNNEKAAQVVYSMMEPVPRMAEWIAGRKESELAAEGFTVVNKSWSNGIRIKGTDLRRNLLGQYTPKIQELAYEGFAHKLRLLEALLNTGFATACYDGEYFFDSDHPRNSGLADQTNLVSGALSQTTYLTARAQLMSITDKEGKTLRLRPTHLIVAPNLEGTALSIVKAERASSGATNVTSGMSEVLVLHGLTASYWFVADLSRPVKPLVMQTEREVSADSLASPNSDDAYKYDIYRYGASWDGNAGYSLWQLIQGSTGS